jgi:hypothetical protein
MKHRLIKRAVQILTCLVVALAVVPSISAQKIDRPNYDYSTPEASFRSFQEAIRKEDAEGVVIHSWQLLQHSEGNEPETQRTLKEQVEQFKSRKNFSFQRVDSGLVQGNLKITEAKFVRWEATPIEDLPKGVSAGRILIEWAESGKQAYLDVFKIEKTKGWWISVSPERVKTFDTKKNGARE